MDEGRKISKRAKLKECAPKVATPTYHQPVVQILQLSLVVPHPPLIRIEGREHRTYILIFRRGVRFPLYYILVVNWNVPIVSLRTRHNSQWGVLRWLEYVSR